jgi:hypothetical protein
MLALVKMGSNPAAVLIDGGTEPGYHRIWRNQDS